MLKHKHIENREQFMKNNGIEILDKIGQGSHGSVWICKYLNSLAASKILEITNYSTNLLEPIIMASIKEKYINSAKEILLDKDNWNIMIIQKKLVPINIWRKSQIITSQYQIKNMISQILNAIYFIHYLNIIHCDLKCSNILLDEDSSQIHISDFSLSRFGNKKYKNQVVCTQTHRPWEITNKEIWDQKVDIWALGCTIFELVYGYSLFPPQYIKKNNLSKKSQIAKINMKHSNALCEWHYYMFEYDKKTEYSNNQKYKFFNIEYESPKIPPGFNKSENIVDILIKNMLILDQNERPTIYDIYQNFGNIFNLQQPSLYIVKNLDNKTLLDSVYHHKTSDKDCIPNKYTDKIIKESCLLISNMFEGNFVDNIKDKEILKCMLEILELHKFKLLTFQKEN